MYFKKVVKYVPVKRKHFSRKSARKQAFKGKRNYRRW